MLSGAIPAGAGVYRLLCKPTGKQYIGGSVNLRARRNAHRHGLKSGTHQNKHLLRSYLRHGANAFVFEVLETCLASEVVATEQKWLDATRAAAIGFNNSPTACTKIGFRHSAETRKLLAYLAGQRDHSHLRALAEEQRGKPSPLRGKPGRPWTEEAKRKASATRKGRPAPNLGVKATEETRRKISESLIRLEVNRRYGAEHEARALELRREGLSYPKIAATMGVSLRTAYRLVNRDLDGAMRSYDKLQGTSAPLGGTPQAPRQ